MGAEPPLLPYQFLDFGGSLVRLKAGEQFPVLDEARPLQSILTDAYAGSERDTSKYPAPVFRQ